jgi:hypothetical protein
MADGRSALNTPWAACAGVIAGAPATAATQQLLGDALYFDCRLGGPVLGLAVAIAAALLTLVGALVSWRARAAAADDPEGAARRFLAEVSAGIAGVFLLAIVAQALAAVIVPACHR